jgi:hypothetical protein
MSAKTVLLGAAGAMLVAVLVLPGARALDKPGTVTITGTEANHSHLDMGKRGTTIGDVDVYNLLLYNKRITPKAIGRGEMICTRVGTKRQSCTASFALPQGQIAVQGVISSRLIYDLAIVGGTGLYNNVRGSLTVTSLHRSKPIRELLVFRLVV